VVWLGGHAHTWPDNGEFNIKQDVAGARVLFGCGAALVQLPCMGVVSSFTISGPELNYWLKGKNKLCDYLVELTKREAAQYHKEKTWSRVIWDVTAVAWLLDGDLMQDVIVHAPIPEYDHRYSFDDRRHFMKYVYYINRDKLVQDLFEKLSK
jgi:inosine-uridine nucleoside N-ribohydrolase